MNAVQWVGLATVLLVVIAIFAAIAAVTSIRLLYAYFKFIGVHVCPGHRGECGNPKQIPTPAAGPVPSGTPR